MFILIILLSTKIILSFQLAKFFADVAGNVATDFEINLVQIIDFIESCHDAILHELSNLQTPKAQKRRSH
jgi:hypothetical protein